MIYFYNINNMKNKEIVSEAESSRKLDKFSNNKTRFKKMSIKMA